MDVIEQLLGQLGEIGIDQVAPDFPETDTQKKRYRVFYDRELREYSLVYWYGVEQTVNFHHPSRYHYSCDEVEFVLGQQAWVLIRPRKSETKTYWEVHFCSGGDNYEIGNYDTEYLLVDALKKRTLSPHTFVNWVREVHRLDRRVDELMTALAQLGQKWVANEKTEQSRHSTSNFLRRSTHHALMLWIGQMNTLYDYYPWDAADELVGAFSKRDMTSQYAFIPVSVWGYGGQEIVGYVVESDRVDIQADSIPELIEAIWLHLDDLMVTL